MTETQTYILLVLAGFGIAVFVFLDFLKLRRLKNIGQRTKGTIFQVNEHYDNPIELNVRFLTHEKEWITCKYQGWIHFILPGQFKPGQKVNVLYDPNNPKKYSLEVKFARLFSRTILILIAIGLVSFGILHL